jgi:hypothetical protein
MHNRFFSPWWSVELPDNWSGSRDDTCATFLADPPVGALQISAASKGTDFVTDDDLKDFAQEYIDAGTKLGRATYGSFSGFYLRYSEGAIYWKHWWLRSRNIIVYATYNTALETKGVEDEAIERILSTLRLTAESAD